MTEREAAEFLVSAGAEFFDEAIRDEPDGPVEMVTDISRTERIYDVVVGGCSTGDHGKARTIWRRTVVYGATDRTVGGGADFVDAALMQERVACAALELLEARRPAPEPWPAAT
jgi:hypothetical protein